MRLDFNRIKFDKALVNGGSKFISLKVAHRDIDISLFCVYVLVIMCNGYDNVAHNFTEKYFCYEICILTVYIHSDTVKIEIEKFFTDNVTHNYLLLQMIFDGKITLIYRQKYLVIFFRKFVEHNYIVRDMYYQSISQMPSKTC